MQWSSGPAAGFTTWTPWIACNSDYPSVNVELQRDDETSILACYRRLLTLRKEYPVFAYGFFQEISGRSGGAIVYTRTLETSELLVVLNWSGEETAFPESAKLLLEEVQSRRLLVSSYGGSDPDGKRLRAWEAAVWHLSRV